MNKKFLTMVIALFAFFGLFFAGEAKAGPEHNVSGWAWSENIGWISFNNTTGGGGINYGVHINENGTFTGYAWSENIGWIDFSPVGPYPASPNYSTKVNLETGEVSGWARALAHGDGWNGWIKMRGTNYGVSIDMTTGKFSGWAWSDAVVGWISFKGPNYGVMTTFQPLPIVSTTGETWLHCARQGRSIPILNWHYSNGTQAAYRVQIDNTSETFPSPEVDTGVILSSSQSYAEHQYKFNWNTTYWWRVKAKNEAGVWSKWSNVDNFKTPLHAYPWPDFTWSPEKPSQGEVVIFNSDPSRAYGGATIVSYLWTITEGKGEFVDDTSNTSQHPHIIFLTPTNRVTLQITDSTGYSCTSAKKEISVQLPLPEWREIPPIIWLEKLFANIINFVNGF